MPMVLNRFAEITTSESPSATRVSADPAFWAIADTDSNKTEQAIIFAS